MNWDDARVVLAFSRAGNASAAARTLGVSHTTVVRRLQALQADLQKRLVDKTPEGPRLTPAGRELARLAEDMEATAATIERRLLGGETRLEGTVRVTTTEALGSRFLTPHLVEFQRAHPAVEVELVSDTRPLSLARREADVAVRLLRPVEPSSIRKRVGEIGYAAYAAPAYLKAAPERPRLVGYDDRLAGPETQRLVASYPDGRFVFRSGSTAALVAAAVAAAGIAMIPCFLGDAEPVLRRLPVPRAVPPSEIWLAIHRDLRRSARTAALFDFLTDLFHAHATALRG